ncbi:MAG TPA: antitoxin [Actinomycetota bacterium]|nr:antitoxin [Actinomycetota bacterium]
MGMDVLVRDVPDEIVAALDEQASRLGISRTEYLRRRLGELASGSASRVTLADLKRTARTFQDLDDPDVMRGAWG